MTSSRRQRQRSLRTDFSPSLRVRLSRARFRIRSATHVPGLLMGGKVVEPIFVIGAPRSGTSLLFKVLASSSHLAHWPGEAHEVWERDSHPASKAWGSNVLTALDATPEVASRIARSFYLVTGSRKRLIDKTPRNSFRVEFIREIFPDARFVFLQRDGRANVNSLITAWRTPRYKTYRLPGPHSIPDVPDPNWWKFVLYPGWSEDVAGPLEVVAARQWDASNRYALQGLEDVHEDRKVTVRYEELIDRPIEEIGRILEFLGLPYEARLRDTADAVQTTPVNIVTPPERGKWKKENRAEIERIAPLIEHTMKKLGYPIT